MTGTGLGLRVVTRIRWLVLLGVLPAVLAAQVTFEWTFSGPADDRFYSVQPTADGGLVAAWTTTSAGAGGSDYWRASLFCNTEGMPKEAQ